MEEETVTRRSWKPQQLENGRWDCSKCSQTFGTKTNARQHFRYIHGGSESCHKRSSDHTAKSDSPRKVSRIRDSRGKVYKVRCKKNGRWPCPYSCGKSYSSPSSLGEHLRQEVCERGSKVVVAPKPAPRAPTPVVSMRLQLKRLVSNSGGDAKELSSSILDTPAEKHTSDKPIVIKIRKSSDIAKTDANRRISDDTKSSIIVTRDKTTLDIKTIDFKDTRDPKKPDYSQLYPQSKDTRGRVRCARAILCRDAIISDDDAPTNEDDHYLLPFLFRTLKLSKIMEHARCSYLEPTEELELFREEGLRQLNRYFKREEDISSEQTEQPSSAANPTTTGSNMVNPESRNSEVPISISDFEESECTASSLDSPISNLITDSSPSAKRRLSSSAPDDFEENQPRTRKERDPSSKDYVSRKILIPAKLMLQVPTRDSAGVLPISDASFSYMNTSELDGMYIPCLQLI